MRGAMPRVSALLDSALLSTVHVYARVHTSIYGEVPFLAWPESPDTNERGNSKVFVAGPRALLTRAPPRLTSEGIQTIHRLYRLFLIFYISMSVLEQATKVTGHDHGNAASRRPGVQAPRFQE